MHHHAACVQHCGARIGRGHLKHYHGYGITEYVRSGRSSEQPRVDSVRDSFGIPSLGGESMGSMEDSRTTMPGPAEANALLLSTADPRWKQDLKNIRHDVYHLPGFAQLEAHALEGSAVAFRYEERDGVFLQPLIIRHIPDTDLFDAVSPYGYCGPLSNRPSEDVGFWGRACSAIVQTLSGQNLVTCFARLHPLFETPLEALSTVGDVVQHGETLSVDLMLSHEEIWRLTRPTHRNRIRAMRKLGVSVSFDDWSHFDPWLASYYQTMARVQADKYYIFSRTHFDELRQVLGDALHLAAALDSAGNVMGGLLFFEHDALVQNYLSATGDDYLKQSPARLLYHETVLWSKQRGGSVYHLGGGVGGRPDKLYEFKAGFAHHRHPFRTWNVVLQPEIYLRLLGAQGNNTTGPYDRFFPAYRASSR